MELELVSEGDARSSALVVFPDSGYNRDALRTWGTQLAAHFSLYAAVAQPAGDDVIAAASALQRYCEYRGLKRMTVLGIGGDAGLAMQFAVSAQRNVRRLIVINATSRRRPGPAMRLIDRLEAALPLGFPFRSVNKEFDARPMLHRIHCPTLIITEATVLPFTALPFVEQQAALLSARIPNAWRIPLPSRIVDSTGKLSDQFCKMLFEFSQVPVKRPQKGAADAHS